MRITFLRVASSSLRLKTRRRLIPKVLSNDSWRRLPPCFKAGVFGQERVARRCGATRAMRDAVRKPSLEAWGEATSGRVGEPPGASGSLDDAPHRPRLPSCQADRPRDLYGSLSVQLGIIGADGFFATIRASASLSSTSAVNRSDDVVSSAASRLAVGFFVFPLVATVPSPDVKYVT